MTMTRPVPVDVISIQSQVVYGRVGNNAAIPALQACGLQAVAVPTTLLSNTPHYPTVHGGAVPEAWFAGWLDDLEARGVPAGAKVVQVGFLGHPSQAHILAAWWSRMRERHPQLRLHLDPVIGDYDHGVYAPAGMVEAWRTLLAPQAHGLVPNRFELEQLSGAKLAGLDDCRRAARTLLRGRTQWVVVTSVQDEPDGATIQTLLETRDGVSATFDHPRVPCAVKGSGDYFAARLTGHLLRVGDLALAVDQACRDTSERLNHTHRLGWEEMALDEAPVEPGAPAP